MFTLTMTGAIREGRADEFTELSRRAMAVTPEGVDGCVTYRLHLSGDRTRFLLYEQWADQAAVDRHLAALVHELGPPAPDGIIPAAWADCFDDPAFDFWERL